MKLEKKLRAILVAVSLLGGLGVALAQPAPDGPRESAAVGIQSPEANLTPEAMQQEATRAVPGMEQAGQTIRGQLEQAREKRDVVKVLCLNDKLNQVDVAMRSARDRLAALNSAVTRRDAEQARHEYRVVVVLKDRIRALVQEANQCIGEETGFVGDSRVTVEIDPAVPQTDTTEFPEEPIVNVPPMINSPTQ